MTHIYIGNSGVFRIGPNGMEFQISPGQWVPWTNQHHSGGTLIHSPARPIGGNMQFEGRSAGWSVGEIYGHRVFNISYGEIWSPVQSSFRWKNGKNTSECHLCGIGKRYPNCTCGFYAFYEPQDDYEGNVRGIVKGYGMVDKGTRGFKAQHSDIVAISVPKYLMPADYKNIKTKALSPAAKGQSIRDRYNKMNLSQARVLGTVAALLLSLTGTALVTAIALSATIGMLVLSSVATALMLTLYVAAVRKISNIGNTRGGGRPIRSLSNIHFNYKEFVKKFPDIEVFTSEKDMYAAYADKIGTNRKVKVNSKD